MSELLAQVQQLLAGASSQPLTAAQLSQILSALAAGPSADPAPSLAVPPITSPTLVITPPPTITFSPVVTPYKTLGKLSDILHLNNRNNQLERRAWPPRNVPLDA